MKDKLQLCLQINRHILDNNLGGRSVTNDAENVVEYLYSVYGNRRIFYIDSEGVLDELRHNNGNFVGFGS